MKQEILEISSRDEVTDIMLKEATSLFNENYGVWGTDPTNTVRLPKKGSRVRLNKERLRAQCLPSGVDCCYAKATVNGQLAGNVLACRWKVENRTVCWVAQLVVHRDFRRRGLATRLLSFLRRNSDAIYGIASSHPAACKAVARAFGKGGICSVNTDFISENAKSIMEKSPVEYIRNGELRGNIFDPNDTSGSISSVNTCFFVDHKEPLEALDFVQKRGASDWPLGKLLDGHEFLLIVEAGS